MRAARRPAPRKNRARAVPPTGAPATPVARRLWAIDNPPLSRDAEAEGTTAAQQPKHAGASAADWRDGRRGLSWRGEELARTVFDAFDADADGSWTFADFRRYLEAVGRGAPHLREYAPAPARPTNRRSGGRRRSPRT